MATKKPENSSLRCVLCRQHDGKNCDSDADDGGQQGSLRTPPVLHQACVCVYVCARTRQDVCCYTPQRRQFPHPSTHTTHVHTAARTHLKMVSASRLSMMAELSRSRTISISMSRSWPRKTCGKQCVCTCVYVSVQGGSMNAEGRGGGYCVGQL